MTTTPTPDPLAEVPTRCWCGTEDPYFSDELDETCGGSGVLHCFCGGDLCVCCNHGELQCPGCEDCEDYDDE